MEISENDSTRRNGVGQHRIRECTLCRDPFVDYEGCVLVDGNFAYELCAEHLAIHAQDRVWFQKLMNINEAKGIPLTPLAGLL